MKKNLSQLMREHLRLSLVLTLLIGLFLGALALHVYFKSRNDAMYVAFFSSKPTTPTVADEMRKSYIKGRSHVKFKYHDPTNNGNTVRAVFEGSIVDTMSFHNILATHPDSIYVALGVRDSSMNGTDKDRILTTIIYGIRKGALMRGANDKAEDYTNPCPPCNLVR